MCAEVVRLGKGDIFVALITVERHYCNMNSENTKRDRAELELSILYRISQRMAQQHDVSSLLNDVLDIMETEMGLSL
ncbi:MAG: hypothetical protein DRP64_05955, partial [Verrucomicrobia bacterium]